MKRLKPVTPGSRFTVLVDKQILSKKVVPLKFCLSKHSSKAGRNNRGIITVRGRKRGHKKRLKLIHLKPKVFEGFVESIEYSSMRTANVARIFVPETKYRFYLIAAEELQIGSSVSSAGKLSSDKGCFLSLFQVPLGIVGFCLEVGRFRIASSAGCFIRVLQKGFKFSRVKLPSGEERLVPSNSMVCIGQASNKTQNQVVKGKAGRSFWLGKGPKVRGVAKNPVDHPHGGGEGKTSGGRPSVSPWGKPAHKVPTSRSRSSLIVSPRGQKRYVTNGKKNSSKFI